MSSPTSEASPPNWPGMSQEECPHGEGGLSVLELRFHSSPLYSPSTKPPHRSRGCAWRGDNAILWENGSVAPSTLCVPCDNFGWFLHPPHSPHAPWGLMGWTLTKGLEQGRFRSQYRAGVPQCGKAEGSTVGRGQSQNVAQSPEQGDEVQQGRPGSNGKSS